MDEVLHCLRGLSSYWVAWLVGALLLAANVLARLRGFEPAAATVFLLAAQVALFDIVVHLDDLIYGGSLLSHAGPAAAWSWARAGLFAWGACFLAGALPLLPRLRDPRVRDAVRELRWTFGALGGSAISVHLYAFLHWKLLFP